MNAVRQARPGRDAVIETRQLGKVYAAGSAAEVVALRDVDLRIARGEFVAIMGPSGSGKSTLMNLLGCLDTPSAGTYHCDGVDVASLDAEDRARLRLDKIGFVFQGFNLLPRMSALENVSMPQLIAGKRQSEADKRSQELLDLLGVGARATHRPAELSGGEQQRVAIARAAANHPQVILADEPTGNLDPATSELVFAALQDLIRNEGAACLRRRGWPRDGGAAR